MGVLSKAELKDDPGFARVVRCVVRATQEPGRGRSVPVAAVVSAVRGSCLLAAARRTLECEYSAQSRRVRPQLQCSLSRGQKNRVKSEVGKVLGSSTGKTCFDNKDYGR